VETIGVKWKLETFQFNSTLPFARIRGSLRSTNAIQYVSMNFGLFYFYLIYILLNFDSDNLIAIAVFICE